MSLLSTAQETGMRRLLSARIGIVFVSFKPRRREPDEEPKSG
jgi:hypothetical protein